MNSRNVPKMRYIQNGLNLIDKININRQMYPTLSINFRLSTVLTFAGIDKLSLSDRAKINCHEYVCTV